MKQSTIIFIAILVVLVGVGAYFFWGGSFTALNQQEEQAANTTQTQGGETEETDGEQVDQEEEVIGTSAGGRDITAFHYGTGDTELLFVGGIHGGYEWNTVLLAYQLIDHLKANSDIIPENVKVTVVPVLNPDGLAEVVGTTGRFESSDVPSSEDATIPGRFNGNNVDLNRNFDCDWQAEGIWQNKTVSGGSAPFFEPESQAIRDYVHSHNISAAVVYYSAAGGVFASNCHNGVSDDTRTLTNLYAEASGYPAYESWNFYEITGDMVNWLAKENVPAISVLLTNHQDVEWEKNQAGVEAMLQHYAQ